MRGAMRGSRAGGVQRAYESLPLSQPLRLFAAFPQAARLKP